MREKKKLDTHPSGSANVKVRKWVFYNTMAFLTPYVAPHATSSNVPPPLEEMNTEVDTDDAAVNDTDSARSVGTASNVDVCEEESSTSAMKQPSSTAKKKTATKKRCCELQSDVDEQIVGELQKMREQAVSRNGKESDSDCQFLLSLLPLIKQLSPMDNLDIKIEIQLAFRRKLAANEKYSYGYRTASLQKPSEPSPYAYERPSPYAYERPSPYANERPSPYANETTSAYGHETPSPYAHETTSAYGHQTTSAYASKVMFEK
ncbi:uncharacterized protein LOC119583702 [Penaeus monodon]|uniref:uncharacterized protein LOC119583702 n=1 Tax=Penaeus monodon TaxID=6687 RepID=UPI0018A759C6|nr:uncharacterized protein LOC119583702 [Penaeus monodon]